ncbi:MAG: hypothetical protein K2M63_09235 [Muribaculaceae bacterium]|nr:hypothetical protein [Muribaculaceae bacterium]
MTFQELDIIKSRTLFLKNNIASGEVILSDPDGGDMYFTFRLRYIDPDTEAKTTLTSVDQFHATVEIDVRPNAIIETEEPLPIGTYGKDNKPLYLGIVVQPQIANSGQHNVIITFYTGKEAENGN